MIREKRVRKEERPRVRRNCGSVSGPRRGGGGEKVETGARREGEGAAAGGSARDGERRRETGQEKINRPANMCREKDEGRRRGREGRGRTGWNGPTVRHVPTIS